MLMTSTLGRRLIPGSLLLLALTGCSDSSSGPAVNLPRKAVAGTVTLDGQPLAQGKIQFQPVGGGQGPTAVANGDIKDGKYSIDRAVGPVPGNYKVSISSQPSITIGPDETPGPRPKMDPEKVPAQYNTKTTLTKEVKDETNTFDFDLKSK